MSPFEWNKIAGAVLLTFLILLVINITADAIFSSPPLDQSAYAVALEVEAKEASTDLEKPVEENILVLLASVDPALGARVFNKCKACHVANKDGGNKIGPNLWGIVGRPVAAVEGFAYSPALRELGGAWTPERLSGFLQNPKSYAAGTKMVYAGLKKAKNRAEIIAWLQSNAK